MDPDLPRLVLDALETHCVAAQRLCLELTETLALSQLETVDRVLGQLYDIGVKITLDGFGTGSSSLQLLSRIPVHQLKIDSSVIGLLRVDPAAQARDMVRSIAELGRALGLAAIADGVESDDQRRRLWQLGCTAGQGDMFASAIPAHELLALLTRGVDRPGALAQPLHDVGHVRRLTRLRRY